MGLSPTTYIYNLFTQVLISGVSKNSEIRRIPGRVRLKFDGKSKTERHTSMCVCVRMCVYVCDVKSVWVVEGKKLTRYQ